MLIRSHWLWEIPSNLSILCETKARRCSPAVCDHFSAEVDATRRAAATLKGKLGLTEWVSTAQSSTEHERMQSVVSSQLKLFIQRILKQSAVQTKKRSATNPLPTLKQQRRKICGKSTSYQNLISLEWRLYRRLDYGISFQVIFTAQKNELGGFRTYFQQCSILDI